MCVLFYSCHIHESCLVDSVGSKNKNNTNTIKISGALLMNRNKNGICIPCDRLRMSCAKIEILIALKWKGCTMIHIKQSIE